MSVVASTGSPQTLTKKIPGEAGVWLFILGDMTIFAILFVVYLVERGKERELFDLAQTTLNKNFGAVNTLLLLISSLFVVLAAQAMRADRRALARSAIGWAFLCGVGFVVIKVVEYHERVAAGETPATNNFYLYYFVLTGLHLLHLLIGLVILIVLRSTARKPELSKHQWALFEGGTCFWHMVDLLWLVLFPLIFLVR